MARPLRSFPAEILLTILGEVLADDFHVVRREHKASRGRRLSSFRNVAICKAWLDAARTVFWGSVAIFTLAEFIPFARAINDPSAKLGCIRYVYFRMPDYLEQTHSPPGFERVAEKVSQCLPAALLRLPTNLRVLHVDCNRNHHVFHEVLYDSLLALHRDHPSWFIDVDKLEVWSRHDNRDVFPNFAFVRRVRQLVLRVTDRDADDTFKSPCTFAQVQSLALDLKFSGGVFRHMMPWVIGPVTSALRSATRTVQFLALDLRDIDEVDERARIESIKQALSINAPSLSVLVLRVHPTYDRIYLAKELTQDGAFCSCPSLRRLELHGTGVSQEVFRQIGCWGLQQLGLTVLKETTGDIMTCLALPELAKLEALEVRFEDVEEDLTSVGEEIWAPLEAECVDRGITCVVQY